MPDLDAAIRARLAEPAVSHCAGCEDVPEDCDVGLGNAMAAALLAVLDRHKHVRTGDGSGYYVEGPGMGVWEHDFGCVHCHRYSYGGEHYLKGLGWCGELRAIATALGVEADEADEAVG
jgi:hypothetical protein